MKGSRMMLFAMALAIACLPLFRRVKAGSNRVRDRAAAARHLVDRVRIDGRIVRRSVIHLNAGECVLIEPPPQYLSLADIQKQLIGNPDSDQDNLELYRALPDSLWDIAPADRSDYSTFNCATFAIGENVGLGRNDWLEPLPTDWSHGISPAQVVLDEFYQLIATYSLQADGLTQLDHSTRWIDGDVVVFFNERVAGGLLHFAKLETSGHGIRLVGKLGRGPIVRGTLTQTASRFQNEFTQVRVYRRRPVPL